MRLKKRAGNGFRFAAKRKERHGKMKTMTSIVLSLGFLAFVLGCASPAGDARFVELPAGVLEDKIQGGMLGQILGDLNGLMHEGKYIHEPGKVETYTPALRDGAWADDDMDIEWVYITAMQRLGKTYLAPDEIIDLWQTHINRRIWMSNQYARQLMDLGIRPPLTGRIALNPWAEYNVSGHFVCETFGLLAPAMPRTAAKIGLHYTHVTIDGEPAQSTQLFDTMIAVAFVENDVDKVLAAGLAATDPASETHRIVQRVISLWKENPRDWKACRKQIKELYQTRANGGPRDWAGTELNTAAMIGAWLYGRGDFTETLRLAFNFGWDADCNAATLGTILGVMKGRQWMDRQGWVVKDVFRNRTPSGELVRDNMPEDETITSFGNKVIAVAKRVIVEQGGAEIVRNGTKLYRVRAESPANVDPLPRPIDRGEELRRDLLPPLANWLTGSQQERARAAYVALCLGESERLAKDEPQKWHDALEALKTYPQVLNQIRAAAGSPIRKRAQAAGLR